MKNFEKWEKELIHLSKNNESFAVLNGKPVPCHSLSCNYCDINNKKMETDVSCHARRIFWLYQEYIEKPKLNKYEKHFVKH